MFVFIGLFKVWSDERKKDMAREKEKEAEQKLRDERNRQLLYAWRYSEGKDPPPESAHPDINDPCYYALCRMREEGRHAAYYGAWNWRTQDYEEDAKRFWKLSPREQWKHPHTITSTFYRCSSMREEIADGARNKPYGHLYPADNDPCLYADIVNSPIPYHIHYPIEAYRGEMRIPYQ